MSFRRTFTSVITSMVMLLLAIVFIAPAVMAKAHGPPSVADEVIASVNFDVSIPTVDHHVQAIDPFVQLLKGDVSMLIPNPAGYATNTNTTAADPDHMMKAWTPDHPRMNLGAGSATSNLRARGLQLRI